MISMTNSDIRSQLRQAHGITRRYLVTNGFDGALTMLGLMVGFETAGQGVDLAVALNACLGAAVALLASGLSSAYLSEAAERQKELHDLEAALLSDLTDSHQGRASRAIPILVALVNGLSPFCISLIIMMPLWLADRCLISLPVSPFLAGMAIALGLIFMLGIFLGRISKTFWLWMGLRTLLIGLVTVAVIVVSQGLV